VARVQVFHDTVIIRVYSGSDAMVKRICEQARRYIYAPNPYGPKLRSLMIVSSHGPGLGGLNDKNDACVAVRDKSSMP
jgi:hypothetical protein